MHFVKLKCEVHVVEEDRFEDLGEMNQYWKTVQFTVGFYNRRQARSAAYYDYRFEGEQIVKMEQYLEQHLKPRDWMNDLVVFFVGDFSLVQDDVQDPTNYCDLSHPPKKRNRKRRNKNHL